MDGRMDVSVFAVPILGTLPPHQPTHTHTPCVVVVACCCLLVCLELQEEVGGTFRSDGFKTSLFTHSF